ncbi:MAG: 2Fe-2S iron-sulfur cluster binding domain-containing protein [Rhodobacteraceae bacterium]|nr:2Fe-2S iron-sulfur cluster binding domain-containing protein [Paracoccaceae bacterium]
MPRIKIEPSDVEFECPTNDTILRAALRAGIGMPYSCNVGSCGNCRFVLIEGEVEHNFKQAPAWSERELKRNRWLGCQATPKSDCIIKFRADPTCISPERPQKLKATLVETKKITRDISEFCFSLTSPMPFQQGQYALISHADIEGGRAFSMSSQPDSEVWKFMIKKIPEGKLTDLLFNSAKNGDTFELDGPFGTAYLRPEITRDLILMAGGSGLSPMVSIAEASLKNGMLEDRKLHFYYGARTADDLFDLSVFSKDLRAKMQFTAVLSDPVTGTGWQGKTGFLHEIVAQDFADNLAAHEIYFAGPAIMSASIQKAAHELGVPMSQLWFDEFY